MTMTASDIRAALAALGDTSDVADLDALYVRAVGYSIATDDPTITADALWLMLSEFADQIDGSPVAFVVDDGEPCTLAEFLTANADDPEVCEWARSARPGDVFADLSRAECVAAA